MARNNNSFAGMNFTQIMMQQAQKSLSEPVYCRYCGKNLKEPTKESRQTDSGAYQDQWEMRNHAHYSCYEKNIYGGRTR